MSDKAAKTTKNDVAWETLFDRHNILDRVSTDGVACISATQINKVREARLMAKFDQSTLLPKMFRKNKLSILPVSKGDYLIGPFATHEKIEYRTNVVPRQVKPPQLETLDAKNLYSEATALLFAYHSGIIGNIMDCEPDEVKLTVNGRMASGTFSFFIDNKVNPRSPIAVEVNNSQIEIDAGFESPNAFMVCEAKNQAPEELLIRQLYYPYRLWKHKLGNRKDSKPVIPVFLAFSNDIFHAFIYEFEEYQDYNSIRLKTYKMYKFADEDVSLQDITELYLSVTVLPEPHTTFPQADSFPRVLDLLSVLHEGDLTRNGVTLKYQCAPRQTNYYIAACEYLGLIERSTIENSKRVYRLTPESRNIMSLPYKEKHLALIKKILERRIFNEAYSIFLKSNRFPNDNEICEIMRSANLTINDTTIGRRVSTVRGWLNWILQIAVTD